MNVDQNRMLSLTVKVLFSYSHFQNLRENAYCGVHREHEPLSLPLSMGAPIGAGMIWKQASPVNV